MISRLERSAGRRIQVPNAESEERRVFLVQVKLKDDHEKSGAYNEVRGSRDRRCHFDSSSLGGVFFSREQ